MAKAPQRRTTAAPTIDASPTKEFFIDMLTRDIELVPAIIDLIDNCVDGARRIDGDGPYDGLFVRLIAKPEQFVIADNCGGIELDVARRYAFRFGRPEGMARTDHSIGQFGVGMKRALFKLGTAFKVQSTAARSRFVLDVNVPDWSRRSDWSLEFAAPPSRESSPKERRGTVITVRPLRPQVAADFELATFQSRLRLEIERAHQHSISRGLKITLNGTPLGVDVGRLLQSRELRPAFKELAINGSGAPVDIRIYCGVAESRPKDAGWYVFCNGRLVLEADQSPTTGWGERDGKTIPSYHNQFATFRGYVFMESNDAGRLPWNTMKTGVDSDSDVYRQVRREMLVLMRPVIDFLNRLDAEKDREEDEGPGPLTIAMDAARPTDLARATPSSTFVAPEVRRPTKPPGPKRSSVQYQAEIARLRKAMRVSGARSYREVGELTFDYYYEIECEDA